MKQLLVIVSLVLCLHGPHAHAQNDDNNACSTAFVATSFIACCAVYVTLDTCIRYRRGDFKTDAPLKRALTATTTGTIAGLLAATAATFYTCNEQNTR